MLEFTKRRMPPTGLAPCDFKSVATKAREQSREGYVQHVDRNTDGSHSISDWMSDNTIASFSNGQHIGGKDIEEGQEIDEVSNDVKNSYFKKAAQQINQHGNLRAAHAELGNDELVAAHDKVIRKRTQGMNRAIAKEDATAPRFEIQGSMCDYKIVDTVTGEVVADKIYSGHEAHNLLTWYSKAPTQK